MNKADEQEIVTAAMEKVSRVIEQRLVANHDNKMTDELSTGFHAILVASIKGIIERAVVEVKVFGTEDINND